MSQRKLLLADDSITIQKVVNLTFADEGIEVLTVGDGDAAMEKLAAFKPDLIMADVNMPGLNGYQICEKIKQSADFSQTPVILLVGSFEPFDETEAQRVGADDFLTKPFQSIRQLINKVTELLDAGSKSADSAQTEHAEDAVAAPENDISSSDAIPSKFDDAELDDEMIQTNQPGNFAFDELQKFKTKEEPAEDWTKTKSLSAEELRQFSFSSEQTNAPPISDAKVSRPAAIEFDDDDFLEIPFDEEDEETESAPEVSQIKADETAPPENLAAEAENQAETGNQTETAAAVLPEQTEASLDAAAEAVAEPPALIADEQNQNAESLNELSKVSPETIEAIAQRVVERLSDKIVREIAWEVVPQMADLIIKKMAEEKFRE
ncbi:MAG: response regulator [Pyrinomonadaceae bacterium]